jgi:MSHA biogenesis protein MshI
VDAPPVAVAERNQATRWLVREAVNFPIEQAIIDTCEIPIPRARDNAALLYAVITQSSIVSTIKQFFLKMPVTLKYIDISELALCPLMERIPEQEQGCLFLRLSPAGGKLAIYKKNALYIARSIELKLSSLMGDHAAQEIEVLESLALELQRSLDYMSSLFRQNLLSSIVLFPTLLNTLVIQNYLTNSLGMEVKVISLDQILPFETPPSLEQQMQCLVAIGASLRQIHATAH